MGTTTVALVFGGASVEREVSLVSARAIAENLAAGGFDVRLVALDERGCLRGAEDSRKILERGLGAATAAPSPAVLEVFSGCDVAFPIVHGEMGEDGSLQGFFEVIGIPYVGSGVAASALGMNKAAFKARMREAGLPVTPSFAFTRRQWEGEAGRIADAAARKFQPPVFLKPSHGGSSLGITKVKAWDDLQSAVELALEYDETVLLEKGVAAREIECAVLGNAEPATSGCGEIVPGREFYDYEDKYIENGAKLLIPAPLEPSKEREIRELSARAFCLCGCSGLARVDFLLDNVTDAVYLNELNTLPGFTPISMYPKLWAHAGKPMPALLAELIRLAFERHEEKKEAAARRRAPKRLT